MEKVRYSYQELSRQIQNQTQDSKSKPKATKPKAAKSKSKYIEKVVDGIKYMVLR